MAPVPAKAVTILILATLASSAQCLNWCAVHPCTEEATPAPVKESCHHAPASTEQPQPDSNCTHQPMLTAEKAGLAPAKSVAALPAAAFAGPVTVDVRAVIFTAEISGSPPGRIPDTSIILRI